MQFIQQPASSGQGLQHNNTGFCFAQKPVIQAFVLLKSQHHWDIVVWCIVEACGESSHHGETSGSHLNSASVLQAYQLPLFEKLISSSRMP